MAKLGSPVQRRPSSGAPSRSRSRLAPYVPRMQNGQVQYGGFPFADGENRQPTT